jgi:hypothetical protein
METNELQLLWQTLANEKLIGKELARENIERIITQKSCKTIDRLNRKLKNDYWLNISTAFVILALTIFATAFNRMHNQTMSLNGYIFLFMTFAFFTFKTMNQYSKLKLLQLSFTTSSVKESLEKVKIAFDRVSKKEEVITYIVFTAIIIYANIVLNERNGFTNFTLNSLQGYVLVVSIITFVAGPFVNRYIFKKRFSGIMKEIKGAIHNLTNEME